MSTNPFTGKWLRMALKNKFPHKKDFELASLINVSPQAFSNWGRDDSRQRLPSAESLYLGYRLLGIIPPVHSGGIFPDAGRLAGGEWPVRGMAAADDSGGTRAPEDDDYGEPVSYPAGLTLVPVKGDSMSPLVLPGQFVMIDRNREGFEEDGGVVVAAIIDNDWGRREKLTGTYIKRCFLGDGYYIFTSINSAYSPFSAWRDHCRIWPVIGVWFAGRGRPPEQSKPSL